MHVFYTVFPQYNGDILAKKKEVINRLFARFAEKKVQIGRARLDSVPFFRL